MGKKAVQVLWIVLAAVLAFFFIRAGLDKFLGVPAAVRPFEEFGWPDWTIYLTGAGEILGSIALFIPRTRLFGGLLLALIMVGAAFTNVVNGDSQYVWMNVLLLAGSLLLAWQGRRRGRSVSPAV